MQIKLGIVVESTDNKIILVKVVPNEWQCKLMSSCSWAEVTMDTAPN